MFLRNFHTDSDLIVKLNFMPGIVTSGLVTNNSIKISKSDLYLQYSE